MSEQTKVYELIDEFRKEMKQDMANMETRLMTNQNRIESKLDQTIIAKVDKLEDDYIKLDKAFAMYKTDTGARLKLISAVWGVVGSVITSVITAYIVYRVTKG